ncbi:MAG: hypothetical protein EXR50_06480, partial [Dehalococcoidia bacterium]|nr:hypothetical protein [Dehalococcoidia bacterium]
MTSERMQRRIERLLEQADEAIEGLQWERLREIARAVLGIDRENADALAYLAAAESNLVPSESPTAAEGAAAQAPAPKPDPAPALPTSFVNGRYVVKRLLGEGGKKIVYETTDTVLERDVAYAEIKL